MSGQAESVKDVRNFCAFLVVFSSIAYAVLFFAGYMLERGASSLDVLMALLLALLAIAGIVFGGLCVLLSRARTDGEGGL